MDAGEHREPGGRERRPRPRRDADPDPEEHEREQRRQDDVHAGDEAGARDARPLEAERLQGVAGGEQRAGKRRRPHPAATRASAADGRRAASVSEAIPKRSARNAKSG